MCVTSRVMVALVEFDKFARFRCDGKTCHATVGSEKVKSFCDMCHWCWEKQSYIRVSFTNEQYELPTERLYTKDYNV